MTKHLTLLLFIGLIWGQDSTNIEDQFKQKELINGKNEINWLKELGYVSLMETSFLGFSYLSKFSRGKYIVPFLIYLLEWRGSLQIQKKVKKIINLDII